MSLGLYINEGIRLEEINTQVLNRLYADWEFEKFNKVSKIVMDDIIENDHITFKNTELLREIYEISFRVDRLDHVMGPYCYCMADKAKLDSILKEVYGEEEFAKISEF
jgi:hypothetical protein